MSVRFFSSFIKRKTCTSFPYLYFSPIKPTTPILINSRANLSTGSPGSFKRNEGNSNILCIRRPHLVVPAAMDENEEMDEQEKRLKRFNNDFMAKYYEQEKGLKWIMDKYSREHNVVECMFPGVSEDAIPAVLDEHIRRMHVISAEMYQSEIYLGPDIVANRYTIMPKNNVNSLEKLSYGYSWIGVNVNDTILVVAYCDPIRKPPANITQLTADEVVKVAMAEMLEMRDPQRSHNGHAVVSVVSCTPGQDCAPGYEFQNAQGAIDFLEKKLNADCSSLSPQEIQHIAICALQYLIGSAFKPNRVDACGWGNLNGCDMLGDGKSSIMPEDLVLQAIKPNSLDVCGGEI